MRTLLNWHKTICFLAIAVIFASCNRSHDEITDTYQTDYADHTIIMYGCGGGDLDETLILNLLEITEYGYSENVNFTALLKFSEDYQDQYPGTQKFTLGELGIDYYSYSDVTFELNDPRNLAKFILEAKESMPAKKYTLIFGNHGGTFGVRDLPYSMSKAVCYDDYYDSETPISIFDIEDALKIAGGVDLVYFDACLMGMIENSYQLRNQTDYVLGASHVTPGLGGNYVELMDALSNNEDIVAAMEAFIPATTALWKEIFGESIGFDLTLVDVSCLEEVVECVAEYARELIDLKEECISLGEQEELAFYYFNGDSSYYAREYFESQNVDSGYYYYSEGGVLCTFKYSKYSVDMAHSFLQLSLNSDDTELQAIAIMIKHFINKAIIAHSYCIEPNTDMYDVSLGICWSSSEDFNTVGSNGVSLAEVYSLLDFDAATKWSSFLNDNNMRPVGVITELDEQTGEYNDVYYEL